VSARYFPPPHINVDHVLRDDIQQNLRFYRDELINTEQNYFKNLDEIQLINYNTGNDKDQDQEENEQQEGEIHKGTEKVIEEPERKVENNQYKYKVEHLSLPEKKEIKDVSYQVPSYGSTNYALSYTVEDTYISPNYVSISLIITALLISLKLVISMTVGLLAWRRKNNNGKEGETQSAPKKRIKKGFFKKKKGVRFSGVTDFNLKDAKDISFRGVMDYETHNELC